MDKGWGVGGAGEEVGFQNLCQPAYSPKCKAGSGD